MLSLSIWFNGCANNKNLYSSIYYPNVIDNDKEKSMYIIDKPSEKIVIIFTPGSGNGFKQTPCTPERLNSGYGIPYILHDLTENKINNKEIIIDGFCSNAVATKFSQYSMETKPEARAKDIIEKINIFVKSGVPKKQIFVSGHSMGGWTSLLIGQELQGKIGGIIAFAPAFAGKYKTRNSFMEQLYNDRINKLKQSKYINGLVFAFKGDAFNKQKHLEFLKEIKGIDFVPLSDKIMSKEAKFECKNETNSHRYWSEHKSAYKQCFRESQKEKIVNFLKKSTL
jgi:predicted alpha/beta hydrolase family esterase